MISDVKLAGGGPMMEVENQSSFIADTPIDPKLIVQVDGIVLEKKKHRFRLAPFLVVVSADKSVLLQSCRANYDWDPKVGRVNGMFGTCPRLDENHTVQTHTVGFFAANLANSSDIIIYIIDGKDHDNDNNKDYLECRNVAVNVFITRVMNLPSSTPHVTRTVGFSSMKANVFINSSLHVRQCFRELAGMITLDVGIISAEVFLDMVNNGFSSDANAFHGEALFDGVRLQMARRCWLKDLEDVTGCFLNGDMDLVQYAGSYGTMVTAPLTTREEGAEARRACRVALSLCARLHCYKPGKKRCPTCLELGLGTTRFCSEVCLQKCWSTHDVQHKQAKVCL